MEEEIKQYIGYEQLAHKIIEDAKKYEKIVRGEDEDYISKKDFKERLINELVHNGIKTGVYVEDKECGGFHINFMHLKEVIDNFK